MTAPQSTLTPNSKKEQDEAHNPFQQDADAQFNDVTSGYKSTADELKELENYANTEGTDEIGRYANDPKNATKNQQDVKEGEEAGGNINYTGSGGQNSDKKQKLTLNIKDWKKGGPMGVIVAMLLGGGGILGGLMGPSIGIVQFKEAMMKDLNDQLAAMAEADAHLLRTKLKTTQAGFSLCSNVVSIRCKFGTFSKREIIRLKNAGFTIEPDNGDARTKPTKIIFPSESANGDGPRKEVTNPNELRSHVQGNFKAQSALLKGFNPKFGGFTDKVANAVLLRLNIDKRSKIPATTNVEEQERAMTDATQGVAGEIDGKGYKTDEDGRNYVVDEEGNKIYESGEGSNPDRFAEIRDQNLEFNNEIREQIADAEPGRSSVGTMLGNVARGVRITGALDTACTVYNAARALAAASKVVGAMQMAQFAATIDTEADKIKAGDGTAEGATFIGNSLNTADLNKTIRDETTITGVDADGNPIYAEKPNLYYLETAFDSRGYRLAAYDDPQDAGPLSSREQQFTIGGGLVGTLEGVLDTITHTLGLGNDDAGRAAIQGICAVVQSWWMRTLGLVAGIISGVGTFGASTGISVGISVAIGFALPFLKAALADTLGGKKVSGKTKGVDMGNAAFAGNGKMLGDMAAGRGLTPSDVDERKAYQLVANRVNADYVAVETYEARQTPFDIMNERSFLGSIVRTVNPVLLKSSASFSGALTSIPSLIGTAFSGIVPFANAAEVFNAERYKQCYDMGYKLLGIDADNFCNVRYIMTDKQLGMLADPDAIAVWMENNGHIDPEGNAKSDEYNRWLKACTQRETGYGETDSEEPEDYDAETGKICVERTDEYDYFAVFTVLKTTQEARETPPDGRSDSAWWSETSVGVDDEGAGL